MQPQLDVHEIEAHFLERLKLVWRAYLNRREIESANRHAAEFGILKALAEKDGRSVTYGIGAYPAQEESLHTFENNIAAYRNDNTSRFVRVSFTDSLAAFLARELSNVRVIDERLNFGQPGSSAPHFFQTFTDLAPSLQAFNVQGVLVGCGGNALLGRQELMSMMSHRRLAYNNLRKARELRMARFVVYGLPPVYDEYVLSVRDTVEKDMINWVQADNNAVYVSLRKLAGPFGLFPKPVVNSADGTHLAGSGAARFLDAVAAGFHSRTKAGTVIEA